MSRKPKTPKSAVGAICTMPHNGQEEIAPAADPSRLIELIKYHHRQRVPMMEIRKIVDLKLGATLRFAMGWSRLLPKPERDRINELAADCITVAERLVKNEQLELAGKKPRAIKVPDDQFFAEWFPFMRATIMARLPMSEIEDSSCKHMEALAAQLPVWSWCEPIAGFGPRSLAVITAEAGDLSNYANPAKLWKRMGLAVMAGVRQGGLKKTASKNDWIAHGYNAKRRATMFVIGQALIKKQNKYRNIYLAEKQRQRELAIAKGLKVVPSASIPKGKEAECMSLGHIDKRAQRYMEKRLLRDLWVAWRASSRRMKPIVDLMPDSFEKAA